MLLLFSFRSWLICDLIIESFLDLLKLKSTTALGGYRVQIMNTLLWELGDILRRLRASQDLKLRRQSCLGL